MLVLSRKKNESIVINNDITIVVVEIRGDKVRLVCDGCAADLTATISFISPQAEYTPPVIYSESIRAKLVYMVEARPSVEQAALINPGQPIAVRPESGLVQTAQARRTARIGR